MPQTFEVVDAFATHAFEGNPAAVLVLPMYPAHDDVLRHIAREFNLAETAFVVRRSDGVSFNLRWFTPTVEVALCGHATLAAAHVLWRTGAIAPADPALFHTKSGLLTCHKHGDRIAMDFPIEPPVPLSGAPEGLFEAVRACVRARCLVATEGEEVTDGPLQLLLSNNIVKYIGANRMDTLIEVQDEDCVRALAPNFDALAKINTRCIIVTARASDLTHLDFVSRVFAPTVGVKEDPVTGSAHCALAAYWSNILNKTKGLRARQISERGGNLEIDVEGDRVLLIGTATTVFSGVVHAAI